MKIDLVLVYFLFDTTPCFHVSPFVLIKQSNNLLVEFTVSFLILSSSQPGMVYLVLVAIFTYFLVPGLMAHCSNIRNCPVADWWLISTYTKNTPQRWKKQNVNSQKMDLFQNGNPSIPLFHRVKLFESESSATQSIIRICLMEWEMKLWWKWIFPFLVGLS